MIYSPTMPAFDSGPHRGRIFANETNWATACGLLGFIGIVTGILGVVLGIVQASRRVVGLCPDSLLSQETCTSHPYVAEGTAIALISAGILALSGFAMLITSALGTLRPGSSSDLRSRGQSASRS